MADPDGTLVESIWVRHNIAPLLADLKEIDPRLMRETRARIREVGKSIIAAQSAILDNEKGGAALLATRRYDGGSASRRGGYRNGPLAAQLGGQRLVSIGGRESDSGVSRGTRAEIKSGLRVTVPTAATKQARLRVQTTRGDLRGAFNAKYWRHPVYGSRAVWSANKGTGYFSRGIQDAGGRETALNAVVDALNVALGIVQGKTYPPTQGES